MVSYEKVARKDVRIVNTEVMDSSENSESLSEEALLSIISQSFSKQVVQSASCIVQRSMSHPCRAFVSETIKEFFLVISPVQRTFNVCSINKSRLSSLSRKMCGLHISAIPNDNLIA